MSQSLGGASGGSGEFRKFGGRMGTLKPKPYSNGNCDLCVT